MIIVVKNCDKNNLNYCKYFANTIRIVILSSEIYFFAQKIMKRILLKLSGEAIKAKSASNYDPEFMDMLAEKIINLTKKGIQVGIVVG